MSYCSETDVEALTQITISSSTTPTSIQLAQWIDWAEARVTENSLGRHTITDEYLDIPSYTEKEGVYNWEYNSDQDRISFGENLNGLIIPFTNSRRPIISINHLYKNDQSYSSAASWTELTEGPGDGSDFLLLKGGGKQQGYAIYIYDNAPVSGPKRLKLDYDYGLNLANSILKEYCTKLVSINVLQARMGTSSIDGLSYLDGGDMGTSLNTRYRERIEEWKADVAEIERRFFPEDSHKAGIPHVVI